MFVWWLGVACTRLAFIEPPGQCDTFPPLSLEYCLVVPSLAGCSVNILESVAGGDGQQWVYDSEGRLLRYVNAPTIAAGTTTYYGWNGTCLETVTDWSGNPAPDPLPDPPVGAKVIEHQCDAQGQPVTETTYEVLEEERVELFTLQFDNTYDALGQLLSVDVTDEAGTLVNSVQQVWDGQGRVVRRTYPDWDGTGDIDRDYLWDQNRLLGWYEKTDHRDPSLDRIYDGKLLLEERRYLEEDLLLTTTWQYDPDINGPLSVRVAETGADPYTRDMSVRCE